MLFIPRPHALAAGAVILCAAERVTAQDTVAHRLPPVVTVTRDVGRSALDLPFAITVANPDSLRPGQPHVFPEQTFFLLPGVTLSNRNNPSQDPRVSIRGFGARSAFGVRSIRVLRDGMPLTLPDGQTPVDYLDLESVGAVEAIRGTASALYGNASGGVIDIHSAPPPSAPFALQARSWTGSDALHRNVFLFGGSTDGGATFYQGNVGHTSTDGWREYAGQRLTNAYARAGTSLAGTELSVQLLGLYMPLAQNPGALTESQLDSAPRMADPASIRKQARKEVRQFQLGVSVRRDAFGGGGEWMAQAYGGARGLFNPLTFAIVGIDRRLYGAGARATIPFATGTLAHRATLGVDAQGLNDMRRNWANCNAVTTPTVSCLLGSGEKGTLQLEQREIVSSVGPYLRDELALGGGRVRLSGGVRADVIRFRVEDSYLADGDDSGDRTLHAVSPMLGAVVRLAPLHAVYANLSSAFETPTTTELGNQADGSAGLNRDLEPQYSTTVEVGFKGVALSRIEYDVALFDTRVRDELIPYEVASGNGRTYYRNAGNTSRRGVEIEGTTSSGPLELAAAYAYSNFRFREFAVGTAEYEGNHIPGIPVHQFQGAATLRTKGMFATAELLTKSRVFANDANTASAPGFAVVNLRIGGTKSYGNPWLTPVAGVQNLFDRRYVGSVAINASGASLATTKFYEPAAGRTWFVGLSVATGK
jgi:iron complex outermembrane receptor protein